jgi:hypothetical protein
MCMRCELEPILALPNGPFRAYCGGGNSPRVNPGLTFLAPSGQPLRGAPFNLGFTHLFHLPGQYGSLKFRFDVTNLFDQSYQLRNGTGIGVFAPQFCPRRGFFAGMSWVF